MKRQILEMILREMLIAKADVIAVVQYLDVMMVYIFENTSDCYRVTVAEDKTVKTEKQIVPMVTELSHIIKSIQSSGIVQVKENYNIEEN